MRLEAHTERSGDGSDIISTVCHPLWEAPAAAAPGDTARWAHDAPSPTSPAATCHHLHFDRSMSVMNTDASQGQSCITRRRREATRKRGNQSWLWWSRRRRLRGEGTRKETPGGRLKEHDASDWMNRNENERRRGRWRRGKQVGGTTATERCALWRLTTDNQFSNCFGWFRHRCYVYSVWGHDLQSALQKKNLNKKQTPLQKKKKETAKETNVLR